MLIRFPERLTTQAALRFAANLRDVADGQDCDIDFSGMRWIEPLSALIASSEISRQKSLRRFNALRVRNVPVGSYANNFGFFQSFLGSSPRLGKVGDGSGSYAPIRVFLAEDVRRMADQQGVETGEVMEQLADELASILCQESNEDVHETLTYSMREIMRNVIEHSQADRVATCAQYWPARGEVEVAAMDWGIGIAQGLRENPKLKFESDLDALHLALLPGVSGKAEKVKRMRSRSPWTNSGYGLYMTSSLCRRGGSFLIGSGSSAISVSGPDVVPMRWGIPGTAIRLRMQLSNLKPLGEQLEKFRSEAHALKQAHTSIDFLTASMASRALLLSSKALGARKA